MTQIAPTASNVQGPLLVPPAISLLSAANLVEWDDRFAAGITFLPEGIGTAEVVAVGCTSDTKTPGTRAGQESWKAFGIVASDEASAFCYQANDYRARATRQLLAHEAQLIEKELWDAAFTGSNANYVAANPAIADASATLAHSGAVSVGKALAYMEQGIADADGGAQMFIHMRPFLFNLLFDFASGTGALRREGNRWYTAMDNIVVPGRGYTGTGPAGQAVGATEWMYATTPVDVRRSPIAVIPDDLAQAMDRRTNTVTYFAERIVIANFNAAGIHLALQVTT